MTNDHTKDPSFDKEDVKAAAGSVAADIKNAALNKYEEAVTEVRASADDAKAGVADEVKDVAAALRRASEEMRGGSPQERTLGQISSSLADAADKLHDKDLGEMVEMASKVARNNPMLFLGGAALLGFAASRFAKASRDHNDQSADKSYGGQQTGLNTSRNEGNPTGQPTAAVPS
ncbi:MAG: hypothetical protein II336_01545 [Loktanella sp.]|nr:hypothetical protein [Loktanella sp.]